MIPDIETEEDMENIMKPGSVIRYKNMQIMCIACNQTGIVWEVEKCHA